MKHSVTVNVAIGEPFTDQTVTFDFAGFCAVGTEIEVGAGKMDNGLPRRLVLAVLGQGL